MLHQSDVNQDTDANYYKSIVNPRSQGASCPDHFTSGRDCAERTAEMVL